jgi:hypothetical protein
MGRVKQVSSRARTHWQAAITLTAAAVLAGCGGSGSVQQTGGPADDDVVLEAAQADTLVKQSMLNYYTSTGLGGGVDGVFIDSLPTSVADSSSTAESGGGGDRFSGTNVQESGVDEADRVKIDGDVLFSLETASTDYLPVTGDLVLADSVFAPSPQSHTLSAYRLAGDNSEVLSRTTLELDNQTPEGMYLHGAGDSRELIMMSRRSFDIWGYWFDTRMWSGLETMVTWFDASDPANVSSQRTLTVDGQLVSSRKIGNRLILVTRYHPQPEGLVAYPYEASQLETNRTVIENASPEALLPGYQVTENGVTGDRVLVSADNQCYSSVALPQEDTTADGTDGEASSTSPAPGDLIYPSPDVISIITVDLDSQDISMDSTCFVGDTETMYVSTESLYLATTRYSYNFSEDDQGRPIVFDYSPEITTDVHKFSLQGNNPAFKGSSTVPGHLGWNQDRKPFRMSEKDGNLRIVSFDQNRSGSPVTLSVLTEGGNRNLRTVATLPNDNRPAHIGKEGEQLYASRFIGDRAYLVTFRLTDPLYVLDLANPADPYIAGELELPGYSDYLHPVNDGLLVGVGKDAVEDDNAGWGDGRGAWYQGLKLTLFDVSDPTTPVVADDRIFGKRGTDSPALSQHHAFAWLAGNESRNARMAIPMSLHDGELYSEGNPWSSAAWTSNNLLTMEVNEQTARFEEVPDWIFESQANGDQSYVSLYNDRAIIGAAGDLYVIHNGSLHYGQWGSDAPTSVAQ